jgi:sarcosine oxidase subunit beta
VKKTADVVVIGGGVVGTATAYHLAKRGIKVLLLEKSHLGAGSTGLTGGIIRQHYSLEVTARMAHRALKTWKAFDDVVGGDVGFVRTGVLFLMGPEGKTRMAANIAMQKSVGIRVEMLDHEATKEIAPYMETADIGCAAYEPDGGYADGSMSCSAFAAAAQRLGGEIRQGVPVTGIRLDGGKIAGVDTSEGPVDTPVLVNTAGPWGMNIAKMVGVEIPAEVSRHQIVSFAQPHGFQTPRHPVIGDFINGHYMRAETGGLTLAGSIEDDTSDHVPDPDSFNTSTDPPFVEQMVVRSTARIPTLEEGGVQGGWAGLYTVTPDWHAIIDRLEQVPGFLIGLGFSGSGFKMGPVVGEMLADLATGQQECPIDPHPFRLSRFAEGEPLGGDYGYSIVG